MKKYDYENVNAWLWCRGPSMSLREGMYWNGRKQFSRGWIDTHTHTHTHTSWSLGRCCWPCRWSPRLALRPLPPDPCPCPWRSPRPPPSGLLADRPPPHTVWTQENTHVTLDMKLISNTQNTLNARKAWARKANHEHKNMKKHKTEENLW